LIVCSVSSGKIPAGKLLIVATPECVDAALGSTASGVTLGSKPYGVNVLLVIGL
jgi:hypothetical protein